MDSTRNQMINPPGDLRMAAGISIGLAVGAAALLALAALAAQNEKLAKAPIGPSLGDVENWLKRATASLRRGADKLIEEIDSSP